MDHYITVQIISHKGEAYLIEYVDDMEGLIRKIVPLEVLEIAECETEARIRRRHAKQGIPYGVPWECHIEDLHVASVEFANILRKAGVWTFEDHAKDPTIAQRAIRGVLRPIMQTIKILLKEQRSKTHE